MTEDPPFITELVEILDAVANNWKRGHAIKRCGTVASWDGIAYPFADWLRDQK